MSDGKEFNMEQSDVVELIDEDGKEVSFEHLMTLEHGGNTYVRLRRWSRTTTSAKMSWSFCASTPMRTATTPT